MRYILQTDYSKANRAVSNAFEICGNISVTGSVKGMQKIYGWKPKGQVRYGRYIYNIGPWNVQVLKDRGLLKGD